MEHKMDNSVSFDVAKKSETELKHEIFSMERIPSIRTETYGGYGGLHIQRKTQ